MSRAILENIINEFSVDKFISFFRQKSRSFRVFNEVKSEYDDENFSNFLFVGRIEFDNSQQLLIFTIKVKKELTNRSGKKKQYEKGKYILNKERPDAGIFIFYDEKGNFRFSLIYSEPQGKIRNFSLYKRFTYFVSKDQTNLTFLKRIGEGDFSSLESIKDTFSVEPVTKDFYSEIQNWFFWAMDYVEFPDDEEKDREKRNAKSLIRFITRLIFVWFMKEKKLVPATLFDKAEIDKIINYKDKTNSTYYKAILQNLFFATLNTEMRKDKKGSRVFISEAPKNGYVNDGYLQQGFYRYERFIKDKELFLKQFENVPFLNGGLFESLDKKEDGKEIRVDCFSDNPKNEERLRFPDFLFFLEEEKTVDLSKYLEDGKKRKVTGILTILKKYNFTIDENTPIDQEVALDPELLGRIFENLLASYNPETSTTARKATGSYYTPREIVDYMVEESLVHYLVGFIQGDSDIIKKENCEKLRQLLSYSDLENPFDKETTLKLIEAIDNIKIIDPACGSGAFPMGILHKLVNALHKLDPDNSIWKQKLLEKTPPELRAETEKSLENKSLDYIRKLGLIENCIYGVDIQEIAIQITRLRFFISLLVDQDVDDTKPNRDIRPLPHLETKFVAANTLISLNNSSQQIRMNTPETEKIKSEIYDIRKQIFYVNSRERKYNLEKKYKKLREALKEELKRNSFGDEDIQRIANWDPFDQNRSADWFDPEWMFGVTEGFDIVIGNPPYIQLQKSEGKLANLYSKCNYSTFDRMGDIYCLFYEKGLQILKPKGHLCFITSNKWMRAGYGEKLRSFFLKHIPKILIDLGPGIFESATVDTCILLIQKNSEVSTNKGLSCGLQKENKEEAQDRFQLRAVTLQPTEEKKVDIDQQLMENGVVLTKLSNDAWFIGSSAEQRLKEKIERIGKPLKEWNVNIYYGIKTGLNEAFIITTEKRDEILANCKDKEERKRTEAIIKPILRGRDIKRYYYEWAGLWVIVIPAGWTNENRGKEKPEKFISNVFPSLISYLRLFEEKAKKRDDQGDYWWELRHCAYYPEFEKEKVVYSETIKIYFDGTKNYPRFSYTTEKFYLDKTTFFMSGNYQKYFLGILNSKIGEYFLENGYCIKLGSGSRGLQKILIEKIPLPSITPANEPIVKQIEALVDKILNAKKQNKNADTNQWEQAIDQLVYKLYGLTKEEIKIVEGN